MITVFFLCLIQQIWLATKTNIKRDRAKKVEKTLHSNCTQYLFIFRYWPSNFSRLPIGSCQLYGENAQKEMSRISKTTINPSMAVAHVCHQLIGYMQ